MINNPLRRCSISNWMTTRAIDFITELLGPKAFIVNLGVGHGIRTRCHPLGDLGRVLILIFGFLQLTSTLQTEDFRDSGNGTRLLAVHKGLSVIDALRHVLHGLDRGPHVVVSPDDTADAIVPESIDWDIWVLSRDNHNRETIAPCLHEFLRDIVGVRIRIRNDKRSP